MQALQREGERTVFTWVSRTRAGHTVAVSVSPLGYPAESASTYPTARVACFGCVRFHKK